MLTDKQITALLIRADNAVARAQGFDWAPMRPADVEDMASTIRRLQGLLANAAQETLICSCGEARTFNLTGHLSAPSRAQPLAAAAAVNLVKAAAS